MADWLNPLQHVHTMACCVLRKQFVSSVVLTSKVLPDRAVNGEKKKKKQVSEQCVWYATPWVTREGNLLRECMIYLKI